MSRRSRSRSRSRSERVQISTAPIAMARAAALRPVLESLESRWLLAAGGGFTSAGLTGDYFNNTTLTAPASFSRKDVRVDFDWGTALKPGGSSAPGYADIGADNYSVRWTGQLIPRFSETYTFKTTSDAGVRLYIKPTTSGTWTTLIDNWTAHGVTDNAFNYALTVGTTYDIKLEYYETTGSAVIKLKWSSPSTPEEVIEPATAVGVNFVGGDAALANLVNGATHGNWYDPSNSNNSVALDSAGWPTADAGIYLGEGNTAINSGGTYLVQFRGTARVTQVGVSADFQVGGNSYGNTLPAGTGYNSSTGLTTATLVISAGGYNGFDLEFTNTSRSGNTGIHTPDGIADLYVMQPTTLGGNTYAQPGTLFNSAGLSLAAQYSTLRLMDWTNTNFAMVSNWADRTIPANNLWTGWTYAAGTGVTTGLSGRSCVAGAPWEVAVALANQTGKDVYINIPSNASLDYITKLANLFAFGSDGANPYTSRQTSPVWAPLNPNLKLYIEFSNELWNSAFGQAGTGGSGWANQLSQRAVYDYLTNNQNDSLYPGGGANAYNDGAAISSYYINGGNQASFLATYNPNPAPPEYSTSPQYFSNTGSVDGFSIFQGWVGLRLTQIANAFKTAFSETAINATAVSSRIRPVFEWQYGGNWAATLPFMNSVFAAQHPVNYYLYGGGGGWYADHKVNGFADAVFANPVFATPTVTGYQQNPAGSSWTFTGAAGIAANGSSLGNPTAPVVGPPQAPNGSTQTAYLQPGASISQSVNFSSAGWADITFLACQTQAFDWVHGMSVKVDGVAVGQSEGAGYFSGSQNAWAWNRTSAFYVTAGTHTITFTNTWTTGATIFVDDLAIQTVNGMFAETAAQGTTSIPSVKSDVNLAALYGLYTVGYEGGFNFHQNLSSGLADGYTTMNIKGFSSNAPNVGAQANLDPRAQALIVGTLNEFYAAGGTLPVVFQSTGNINSWGVAAPTWYDWNTPKVQAAAAVEQLLPPTPTNGMLLPSVLKPGSASIFNNATTAGQINAAGGYVDWTAVAARTGSYSLSVTTTGSGGSVLLFVDNVQVASGASGGTLSANVTLSTGAHSIRVQANSATSFTVTQVTAAGQGAPASPTLTSVSDGDGSASLTWGSVTGATGYRVRYGTTPGIYPNAIDVGNVTSYTLNGLTNNQQYVLAVDAYNASGESLPSNEKGVIPLAENQSGTLLDWEFTGLAGNESSVACSANSSKVTVSSLTRGSGLRSLAYANSFASEASDNSYGLTLSAAIAESQYYQFTITPASGKKISLSQLSFLPFFQNATGQPGDTRGAGITYSTDGVNFSGGITASGTPQQTTGSLFTVNLSGQSGLQNTTNTVTVRIYLFGLGGWEFAGIGGVGNDIATTGSYASTSSLPAGWSDGDIASPAQAGSASFDGTTWTVKGGGADIWNQSDQFNFASESWTGDGQIVARVTAVGNVNAWAKTGIMFRDSTAANAMNAAVLITPSNGVLFSWRNSTGGWATSSNVAGILPPQWLKLVRTGNSFSAYYSANGTSWTQIGTAQTINMASAARVGLAVTAHDNNYLNTSTFDNVTVSAAVTTPAAPSGLGVTVAAYNQINLSWTDNANNETGFYVDRATDSGFTQNKTTFTLGANATSFSSTGLSPSTTYYYRVYAYNAGGNSGFSNTSSATTLAMNGGVPLGTWETTGMAYNASTAPVNLTGPNVTVSAITRGSGLKVNTQGFSNGFMSEAANNTWAADLANSITMNQYDTFTVSPTGGNTLSLAKVMYQTWNQNGHASFGTGLRYSTDGTNFTTVTTTVGGNATNAYVTADLSSIAALQNTTATVTFRIYFFGSSPWETNGLGNSIGNDVVVLGPATGTSATYEAESAYISGGDGFASSTAGYTGTGYVTGNASGGSVQFAHNMATAGNATLTFRYNLASGTENVNLVVNGVTISGGVTFNSTGGSWGTVSVSVSLLQGANTIQLTTNGQNMPLLDALTVA